MAAVLAPPRLGATLLIGVLLLELAACSSTPRNNGSSARTRTRSTAVPAISAPRGASLDTDGPAANPPPDLDKVPDAVPRLEAVRPRGPNKPYSAVGRWYEPFTDERAYTERGLGSWYGRKYHGLPTASGEPYNMFGMNAAHPVLPIPSYARVRNPANGREIIVRINDRGPFADGRVIDLSYTGALKLGLLRGVAPVEVERITPEMIRSGRYGPIGGAETAVAEPAPVVRPPQIARPAPAPAVVTTPAPVPIPVPQPVPGTVLPDDDADDTLLRWLRERESMR